jgi:hypothetical protein
MCGYSWTTAPKCEYCPECCHEMGKIEEEQPNCHFTINEGDAGDSHSCTAKRKDETYIASLLIAAICSAVYMTIGLYGFL